MGTPGVGVVGPVLARGTLEADHGHHGHHGHQARHMSNRHRPVQIELHKPSDVIVQQVTIAPGGSTGWHSHPGPAVVIVKSGSLTLYDGDDRRCIGTTYSANPATPAVGKVFIDEGRGHVHIGRNEGSTQHGALRDVSRRARRRARRGSTCPDPGNCRF